MKKTNLILIGMPASGKSTVGVILAKVLGYGFIDTDILIQRAQKKRLAQIIKEVGVDGFLEVENRVNASVEADHCVIATGGSAVYGEDAMRHFKEIGHIMYLKTDFETIRKRLGNIRQRGVALREGSGTCMMRGPCSTKNMRIRSSRSPATRKMSSSAS